MRSTSPALPALLLAASGLTWATDGLAAQDASAFGIDDAIDLVRVGSPRLSPDGSRVLFVRTELDWEENERKSRIWMAGADGSDARPFTGQEGDASPAWSPDGRWIAFRREVGEGDDEKQQIFLLRTDGGEARQLTEHSTSVGSFEWAQDGRSLVFEASDSLPDEREEAQEKGYDAIFIDEGPHGQRRGEWTSVWMVRADPDSAAARRLTPDSLRIGDFALSPDGSTLAYTFRTENRRNDQFLSEVALVPVDGGEPRIRTENEAPESDLAWSPDGRLLTWVAPDLEEWALAQGTLYAMDVASGEVRPLAPGFKGDLQDYAWHPDGGSIDLSARERTDVHLYRLDAESGEVTPLSDLPGTISSPSWSADHRTVAFVRETPTEPGDIHVSDLDPFDPVSVTDTNPQLAEKTLAEPRVVTWTSSDGTPVEGLLYLPPDDADGPGALVLEIHGGPAGVFGRSFDADAQVLAAHGYAVLQPNVRGSSGYGDEFLRGNMEDIGGGDYEDLMTGVDHVIEEGIAHPDSLAVKGWSYGGILGGWTITQTERFRAASLGAMVADWRSEFGAGFNFDVVRWYIGGDPWTNREGWLERSAYTHLDQVETPTILFHGERDTTDTMEQSMNFFAGLRHLGVPARFVLFPREGHGISEPRHHRTRLVEELRWFQRWVRDDEDWAAPERPGTEKAAAVSP